MVRSSRARLGFILLAAGIPALGVVAVVSGLTAPNDTAFDLRLLAPALYLSVALIAVLAPVFSGGGNELFPEDQMVAFPVTASTTFAMSVTLTPLNLAWTTQFISLLGVTAFITPRGQMVVFPLLTCLAYVTLVTLSGQAVAWALVGLRQRPVGRMLTWGAAIALLGTALVALLTERVGLLLDTAPTTYVVIAGLNGAGGEWRPWTAVTLLLLTLAVLAWLLGRRACAWALRQPGSSSLTNTSRVLRRRSGPRSARQVLLATDRASVWRSPSLRRGLLVVGLVPGAVAAAAGLEWQSLVLLPALVAAGAGLLFGVNAFCLDGTGAVWLASQPQRPSVAFWSKAQVVAEVCVVAIVVTLAAGSLRTGTWPTPEQLTAVVCCAVVTVARVVALCLHLSIDRPHRADLRGPRDTPAPPGAMVAYSIRLAVSTTLVALVFSALAEVASWQWSVAVAVPLVLLSARRLVGSRARWGSPHDRSRVVMTVAAG